MTDIMATLSHSRETTFAIFAGLAVFTVVGLQAFRAWVVRRNRSAKGPRAIAAIVAIVFMAMLALGFGDMFWEGKKFLNLSFALFGVAGIGILAEVMWGFFGGSDEELRRIDAHEL
jgi:hypothetical protein